MQAKLAYIEVKSKSKQGAHLENFQNRFLQTSASMSELSFRWTLTDEEELELELEEERRATSNLASNLESSVWKADETGVGFGAEKIKFDYNNFGKH